MALQGLTGRTLAAMMIAAALMSCTRTVYVPTQSVKTDSIAVERVRIDSIIMRDSVSVIDRGDTVRIERWRTRYIARRDTIAVERVRIDSIAVPYRVEVERPLTLWQRIKLSLGGWAILAVLTAAAVVVWRHRR